jgi:hypothetical protein
MLAPVDLHLAAVQYVALSAQRIGQQFHDRGVGADGNSAPAHRPRSIAQNACVARLRMFGLTVNRRSFGLFPAPPGAARGAIRCDISPAYLRYHSPIGCLSERPNGSQWDIAGDNILSIPSALRRSASM